MLCLSLFVCMLISVSFTLCPRNETQISSLSVALWHLLYISLPGQQTLDLENSCTSRYLANKGLLNYTHTLKYSCCLVCLILNMFSEIIFHMPVATAPLHCFVSFHHLPQCMKLLILPIAMQSSTNTKLEGEQSNTGGYTSKYAATALFGVYIMMTFEYVSHFKQLFFRCKIF